MNVIWGKKDLTQVATWVVPDKMAAYQTKTTYNRRRIFIPDVNNDRCSNPLKSSNPLEKHRRKLLTMRHTKCTDRKYQNCGHTHSSAKCWGQNKKYKNCGQPTDSSKKMKSFWTALLDGGQGLLVYGVAMIRVWTQLNQYHINVTNTMYKLV